MESFRRLNEGDVLSISCDLAIGEAVLTINRTEFSYTFTIPTDKEYVVGATFCNDHVLTIVPPEKGADQTRAAGPVSLSGTVGLFGPHSSANPLLLSSIYLTHLYGLVVGSISQPHDSGQPHSPPPGKEAHRFRSVDGVQFLEPDYMLQRLLGGPTSGSSSSASSPAGAEQACPDEEIELLLQTDIGRIAQSAHAERARLALTSSSARQQIAAVNCEPIATLLPTELHALSNVNVIQQLLLNDDHEELKTSECMGATMPGHILLNHVLPACLAAETSFVDVEAGQVRQMRLEGAATYAIRLSSLLTQIPSSYVLRIVAVIGHPNAVLQNQVLCEVVGRSLGEEEKRDSVPSSASEQLITLEECSIILKQSLSSVCAATDEPDPVGSAVWAFCVGDVVVRGIGWASRLTLDRSAAVGRQQALLGGPFDAACDEDGGAGGLGDVLRLTGAEAATGPVVRALVQWRTTGLLCTYEMELSPCVTDPDEVAPALKLWRRHRFAQQPRTHEGVSRGEDLLFSPLLTHTLEFSLLPAIKFQSSSDRQRRQSSSRPSPDWKNESPVSDETGGPGYVTSSTHAAEAARAECVRLRVTPIVSLSAAQHSHKYTAIRKTTARRFGFSWPRSMLERLDTAIVSMAEQVHHTLPTRTCLHLTFKWTR